MSDQTFRTAIHARLLALGPIIGRVHDYERWAANPADFLRLFQDPATKKIFGWEISRVGFKVAKAAMNKWRLSHRYVIRGFYGVEDAAATEKAINALADLIILDLTRTKLVGAEADCLPEGAVETRQFGNLLCHVVEIRLPAVAEIISPANLPEEYLEMVGLQYYLTPGDDSPDAVDLLTLWDASGGDAVSFGGSRVELGGVSAEWSPETTLGGEEVTLDGDNPTFSGEEE
jgi:hypothetical protein